MRIKEGFDGVDTRFEKMATKEQVEQLMALEISEPLSFRHPDSKSPIPDSTGIPRLAC